MKYTLPILLLLIVPAFVAGQTVTRDRRAGEGKDATDESPAVRERVVGPRIANHASMPKPTPVPSPSSGAAQKSETTWGNTAIIVRPTTSARPTPAPVQPLVSTAATELNTRKLVQPTAMLPEAARPEPKRTVTPRPVISTNYNVGIGDVLDIRLTNMPTKDSTLFTVLKNGTVEYPLLSGPVSVAGLSTDEITRLLASEIRVIRSPRVVVSVRDYASHSILITGAVNSPGRKMLRRETMPLYAVLAEAMVRADATVARIVRNGKEGEALPLKNEPAMATLVQAGDTIKIYGQEAIPNQFLYIGGEVGAPGEKVFREGMTLTQALLTAGGAVRSQNATVKVARRNAQGFLSVNEYRLRSIEEGKSPDPLIQPGDRIEVIRM